MLDINRVRSKKAIAYYRHSAEDKQENSVPIQRGHAQKFAAEHEIEIIHEEADEGKSGLLSNRPAFERLFNNWILNPDAPKFDYVLVYDVSRWGRFQDQDEAAYYEFRCKQSGKKVVYVSRGFPKQEQQLMSHLQTSIERYMAAEYSRQLSEKVFYGCVKVSEQGYSAGGTPCYGMARILLDEQKTPIRTLKKGEHKQIANERVTFAPLNDSTTQVVRDIFTLLVEKWKTPQEIVEHLNSKKIPSANGCKWTREKVVKILDNETYVGTRIYNKIWGRLKQKNKRNPRSEWVVLPNAFEAVVEPRIFAEAQQRLYWLMPTRWKRGIYLMNKIKRLIRNEARKFLMEKGLLEDDLGFKVQDLPVLFSVGFYRAEIPQWCFMISEKIRGREKVLGISVNMEQRALVDKVFLMPTTDFSPANLILFSEKDPQFPIYQVQKEDIEEKLATIL
jgi:DNA invertase Pin-like site-specific DNA recombinase